MREIIVDRENGAKAFVLFELTKGNIAEIKDRYILEQLRSAIESPWTNLRILRTFYRNPSTQPAADRRPNPCACRRINPGHAVAPISNRNQRIP